MICLLSDGAAEEAGLIVGDYVLAVNGIDVTSIPHSEAANLARQGMKLNTKNNTNHLRQSEKILLLSVR